MPAGSNEGERLFQGIAVSAGICHGKVLIVGHHEGPVPRRTISKDDIPAEMEQFERALLSTRQQILEVQKKVNEGVGAENASVFDAHLLVLEDPFLIDKVTTILHTDLVNIEFAFHQAAHRYVEVLLGLKDEYLRERAADVRDVTDRVLNNLLGRTEIDLTHLSEPCILISQDLTPSITARLDRKMVLGFGTDAGSKTSHTAIMARSLQIPAVVGLQKVSEQLETGDYVLLDGFNGVVIVQPTDQTLFQYGQLVRKQVDLREKLRDVSDKPAVTLDGQRIMVSANIEQADDARSVKEFGAEGVGLFRTEYLFLNRDSVPSEEEQYVAYREVAAALNPSPVVIRTLDLGGDKFITSIDNQTEMNPFLGWRAIRVCLEEKDIFRSQLRAILRASAEGNVKIMYPMISCVDELDQANAMLEECKKELRAKNIAMDESARIGVMIEIPSAALTADSFAKRVSFFSIGTNDLIQYTLAVDRLNERIAHLYEPTHPAILRLIKTTVEAAHRANISVSVCGEMAGDPVLVPLLLGLGVDELSVAAPLVPQIKFIVRRLKMSEAVSLAQFALDCDSGKQILERAQTLAQAIAPSLFENEV